MTDDDDTIVIDDPKSGIRRARRATQKPEHYVVVCISMYTEDRDTAHAKVALLKERGLTQMSLSRLIRLALDRLDVNALERDLRASGVRR